MEQSSLVKWVDELQGQIDALKRDIASIPAPPDASSIVTFGTFNLRTTIADSAATATGKISGTFDTTNYDYLVSLHVHITDTNDGTAYLVEGNVVDHKIGATAKPFTAVRSKADGTSAALVAACDVLIVKGDDGKLAVTIAGGSDLAINSGDTDYSTDYTVIAVKKPVTNNRNKKKK